MVSCPVQIEQDDFGEGQVWVSSKIGVTLVIAADQSIDGLRWWADSG